MCSRAVDKGVGSLPDLLPGFKLPSNGGSGGFFGGWLDKLPWLGKISGLGGGDGQANRGLFDLIFKTIEIASP